MQTGREDSWPAGFEFRPLEDDWSFARHTWLLSVHRHDSVSFHARSWEVLVIAKAFYLHEQVQAAVMIAGRVESCYGEEMLFGYWRWPSFLRIFSLACRFLGMFSSRHGCSNLQDVSGSRGKVHGGQRRNLTLSATGYVWSMIAS